MPMVLTLFCAVLAIAGCSSTNSLKPAPSTTANLYSQTSAFPYQDMSAEQVVELDISESSPAFIFPEGHSYFAAFSLPKNVAKLDYMAGTNYSLLPAISTVFVPQFMFLDNNFNSVLVAKDIPVVQSLKLFSPGFATTAYWSATVEIPPSAKYFAVYTSEQKLREEITYYKQTGGQVFMSGNIPVFIPSSGAIQHKMPRVKTGPVKLRVR